jgi:hypothetical protein
MVQNGNHGRDPCGPHGREDATATCHSRAGHVTTPRLTWRSVPTTCFGRGRAALRWQLGSSKFKLDMSRITIGTTIPDTMGAAGVGSASHGSGRLRPTPRLSGSRQHRGRQPSGSRKSDRDCRPASLPCQDRRRTAHVGSRQARRRLAPLADPLQLDQGGFPRDRDRSSQERSSLRAGYAAVGGLVRSCRRR